MLDIVVPGRRTYELEHLVLDLNGTIALDGEMIEGVEERLSQLSQLLNIAIVTADTHGSAQRLEESLGIRTYGIAEGGEDIQKLALLRRLGPEKTVSIGNGCNDVPLLKESALSICVVGGEGAAVEAMTNSDLVVSDIKAALDLLLNTKRLIATLRK
ncbi:MAG: HAD family hydrolase [Chloroflexi bacterium]|jgi:soluble P-type ATPase|nr:HAD family hydrolase [Chloroflexota bacterium]